MERETFERVIDRAAEMCGGQNALGRYLGVASSDASRLRSGKQALSPEKIEKLAQLMQRDPGELWLLSQVHKLERRNPFRGSKTLAIALCIGTMTYGAIGDGANVYAASRPVASSSKIYTLSELARRLRRIIARLKAPIVGPFSWLDQVDKLPC